MATRTQAREIALQVLFQDDLNPRVNPAVGDQMIGDRLGDEALSQFARELVAGVRRNRAQLDQAIAEAAANWSLERMAATDRAVLRIGAFEILHHGTPPAVAIDEAVELARRFGSAQSGPFVNGVLDAMARPENETETADERE